MAWLDATSPFTFRVHFRRTAGDFVPQPLVKNANIGLCGVKLTPVIPVATTKISKHPQNHDDHFHFRSDRVLSFLINSALMPGLSYLTASSWSQKPYFPTQVDDPKLVKTDAALVHFLCTDVHYYREEAKSARILTEQDVILVFIKTFVKH